MSINDDNRGVSLVVATLGINNIHPLLDSLEKQTCVKYECIVVDQSEDKVLQDIVSKYRNIKYVGSSHKGNSYNRNIGIMHSTLNILAFPDDDCYFSPNVVERVLELFLKYPHIVGVSGSWRDNITGEVVLSGSKNKYVNSFNVWTSVTNITIFLKSNIVKAVGGYNETFGLGSKIFEGGEETDFILKIIENGSKILYEPELLIYHQRSNYTFTKIEKQLGYEESWGALFRKWANSRFIGNRIICACVILILKTYLGAIYYLFRGEFRYAKHYMLKNKARYAGWIKYGELLNKKIL
jgi:glycosyltransferase involved in cell wall biosynthesis